MSKGIITGKPTKTRSTVKLGINDETNPDYSTVPPGTVLKFGPAYPSDPKDVYPYVHENDYIEFTITSYYLDEDGITWTGSCDSIKKIQSKGTVRSASASAAVQGTLIVTLATPNNCGMVEGAELTFNNKSGVALKQNDKVEFDHLIKDESTGKITCDVTGKI